MNLKSITSIVPKIIHSVRYGEQLRPRRDWLVLTVLCVAGLIASVVSSTFFFMDIVNREPAVTGSRDSSVDTSVLEETRAAFSEREQEALRYRSEYRFIDPSH
mgnify:CR=1 FL=1